MKILISIKPQFVEKIRRGEKKFEFRRVLPRHQEISHIIVYASKPVGKVVGEITVAGFLTLTVDEMWNTTKDISGLTREEFFNYFHDKENAHAIAIESYRDYEQPIPLGVLLPGKVPPQSYCYLNGYEEWRASNAARLGITSKIKTNEQQFAIED